MRKTENKEIELSVDEIPGARTVVENQVAEALAKVRQMISGFSELTRGRIRFATDGS